MLEARYPTGVSGGGLPVRAWKWAVPAAALFALVAVVYVVGAELSWHSFGSGLAFGFPPAGVDVAVLLLVARRYWPAAIAAIAAAEAGVDVQHHLLVAGVMGSAAANVVSRWWAPHACCGSAGAGGPILARGGIWPGSWPAPRCSARWRAR